MGKKRINKKIKWAWFVLLLSAMLTACQNRQQAVERLQDIPFQIVSLDDIGEDLKAIINEKKDEAFKFTFVENDELYICVAYGRQETGGYSIVVPDVYLTKNAIYVHTILMGPSKEEIQKEANSYPTIVIKTKNIDKSVVFE